MWIENKSSTFEKKTISFCMYLCICTVILIYIIRMFHIWLFISLKIDTKKKGRLKTNNLTQEMKYIGIDEFGTSEHHKNAKKKKVKSNATISNQPANDFRRDANLILLSHKISTEKKKYQHPSIQWLSWSYKKLCFIAFFFGV